MRTFPVHTWLTPPAWAAVLLLAFLALPAVAQEAPADKPGPAVGAKAPAFNLKDQQGREHSLEALLQKSKVALVFYRSADW